MKFMKNKMWIMAAVMYGLTACETDVLDKKPLGELGEDAVWADVDMARLFINNIYTDLPGGLTRDFDSSTEIGEGGHNWHPAQSYNVGSISPFNSPYDEWGLYSSIRNANTFLQRYTTLTGDAEAIDRLHGEALFLRAYLYAELVSLYGGVPYITEPQLLEDDLLVSRNSYEECVELIIADLDQASELLPESWDDTNVGRATIGAALALKARVLLYAASPLNNANGKVDKWQLAAEAAKAVIDRGAYALYSDYYQLFHRDNNEEVIFDIQFAYPARINDLEYRLNPQGFGGPFGMTRPTQEFVDRFEMSNGLPISDSESGYDPNNPYVDRDPRFYASVIYNGSEWRGKTIETFVDGQNGPGDYDEYETSAAMTGYYIRKFITETNSIVFGQPNSSDNWILMRYAEVLLNYAEAQNEASGPDGSVYDAVNNVRDRAGMPELPLGLSQTEMRQRIQNERTIELGFEELHFFDVRRWKTAEVLLGLPVHKMTITKNGDDTFTYEVEEMEDRVWNDSFYYLPINQDEIDKNPNLSQTDGY